MGDIFQSWLFACYLLLLAWVEEGVDVEDATEKLLGGRVCCSPLHSVILGERQGACFFRWIC